MSSVYPWPYYITSGSIAPTFLCGIALETFERYADGECVRKIVESFNARGLRTSRGAPFSINSFQAILKNRRYLGEYRYKDTVIPDAIPAIITPEVFEKVQRRCEQNKKAPAHTKTDVNYMLTTKLFCGKCGAMMAGESGKSHTGAWHYYYKCGNHKRHGRSVCDLKAVRKEPLERFVVKVAIEKVLKTDTLELLAQKLLEYQNKENTRLPVLQAGLKDISKRINNIVSAIEQGIFTPATKQRLDELEEQRKELEASILQEQIAKPLLTREQILFWFERFRQGDPSDPAYQQKIIDCFVNSVYIFDDHLVINFNYRDGDKLVSLQEVKSSFLGGNRSPLRNGLRAIQKAPLRRGFSHASASFPHPPTKFCGASFRGVQWHLCFSVCMVFFSSEMNCAPVGSPAL